MIPLERQRTIINLLSQQDVISIAGLVSALDVSHMTIRRDIARLEEEGQVISVSGGVRLARSLHQELPHDTKISQQTEEKKRIGQLACAMIPARATVYLDAGTTTLEIAHGLHERSDLTIITNDFAISSFLMLRTEHQIYHTGGRIDRENQSSVGIKVAEFLSGMNIDIAFISTSSWTLQGISTPEEDKVVVKQAVASASRQRVLVTDSSKYGQVARFHALDLERLDTIITDPDLPETGQAELRRKGISLVS